MVTTCHLCLFIRNHTVYLPRRVSLPGAPSRPLDPNLESAIRERSLLEVFLPTLMKVSGVSILKKERRLEFRESLLQVKIRHLIFANSIVSSVLFSISKEEINASFRRFGSLVVDWPHKAESKSYFPPKGYAFLLFQVSCRVFVGAFDRNYKKSFHLFSLCRKRTLCSS